MRTLRQIHAVSQQVAPWSAHIIACVLAGGFLTLQYLVQAGAAAG